MLPLLGMLAMDVSNFVLSLTAAPFDGKGLIQLMIVIDNFCCCQASSSEARKSLPHNSEVEGMFGGPLQRDNCCWFKGKDLTH